MSLSEYFCLLDNFWFLDENIYEEVECGEGRKKEEKVDISRSKWRRWWRPWWRRWRRLNELRLSKASKEYLLRRRILR